MRKYNKFRKSSLICDEDKNFKSKVTMTVPQNDCWLGKEREAGIPIMHLKNIKCELKLY